MIQSVRADMSRSPSFGDGAFDLVFHPVSNHFIEKVGPIFRNRFRVLGKGGVLLCGLDNGFGFLFDETGGEVKYRLPFNPLRDPEVYGDPIGNDRGITFMHTPEEQVDGQLDACLTLTDLYEDTGGDGFLHECNVPPYLAMRAVKASTGRDVDDANGPTRHD